MSFVSRIFGGGSKAPRQPAGPPPLTAEQQAAEDFRLAPRTALKPAKSGVIKRQTQTVTSGGGGVGATASSTLFSGAGGIGTEATGKTFLGG